MPVSWNYIGISILPWLILFADCAFAAETRLKQDWQLVGTVTGGSPLAIIRIKGEVEGIYQLNSRIRQYKIVAIHKSSVILRDTLQSWQLDLIAPQARKVIPHIEAHSTVPVYHYHIDQKTFDSIRTDKQSWLNNTRMEMVIDKGELTGYRITTITENSPADLLGLAKGDIIRGINHIPVRESKRFMAIFGSLQHARKFTLNLEQNKAAFSLVFTIK